MEYEKYLDWFFKSLSPSLQEKWNKKLKEEEKKMNLYSDHLQKWIDILYNLK